jgi:hypothetical protein
VPAHPSFEYAVVRIVPHVDREEFINAGVVLFCEARDFLAARVELDEARLLALAPDADVALVRRHLDAVPRICSGTPDAGPIAELPLRERWRWIVAPRSTILQMSAAHAGRCDKPEQEVDRLFLKLVRASASRR